MRHVLRSIAAAVLFLLFVVPAEAQYFGRNKVQYRGFTFQILKTEHFDVHYYPEEAQSAAIVARMAERVGATSIPHNWGSQIGGYMGLHLAKAMAAVTAAEDDRSTCDVIIAEGYDFRGGSYSVPSSPGLSLKIDEKAYQLKCKAAETVVS